MKKILSLSLVLFGLVSMSFAQEEGDSVRKGRMNKRHADKSTYVQKSAEEIAQARTAHLGKQLSLTEQQSEQVYALELDKANKLKEHRTVATTQRQELSQQMRSSQEELKNILTPEQQEVLTNKMSERRDRGNMMHKKRGKKGKNMKNMRNKEASPSIDIQK